MNKEEIKELKENKDIKYIYKIPCSLFETDLLVIIGNIKTKYDMYVLHLVKKER